MTILYYESNVFFHLCYKSYQVIFFWGKITMSPALIVTTQNFVLHDVSDVLQPTFFLILKPSL